MGVLITPGINDDDDDGMGLLVDFLLKQMVMECSSIEVNVLMESEMLLLLLPLQLLLLLLLMLRLASTVK